jgi:hypothetical protein
VTTEGVTLKRHFISGAFFMTISISMKFRIQTLVDITETRARRQGDDKFAYKQEANFQTVLQTIGLRVNIEYENSPYFEEITVTKMPFDDKYKGKQMLWTFDFNVEYEDALTLEMLISDFDLIPIITGLNETIQLDKALFKTTGKNTNILFSVVD